MSARRCVQGGLIVATGPGIPLPHPDMEDMEPWRETGREPRHMPMQAQEGDYALFLKKHAVEIRYERNAGGAVTATTSFDRTGAAID